MAKIKTARSIENLMKKKHGYELWVALEKKLDLRRMRFNSKKLDPDGIEKLADAYKSIGHMERATIFYDFSEFLSVRSEVFGSKPGSRLNIDCELFCEFLEGYIIGDDFERTLVIGKIYSENGLFKEIIDRYLDALARDGVVSPREYLYYKAMITGDSDLLKTAINEYKESGNEDSDDALRKMLLEEMLNETKLREVF